jgi:flagellar motor switch protein FliN/FliY
MTETNLIRGRSGGSHLPPDGPNLAIDPETAAIAQQPAAGAVDPLLAQADAAIAPLDEASDAPLGDVRPFSLRDFADPTPPAARAARSLSPGQEVDTIFELGRTQVYAADIRKLRKGSIVALDNLVGEPVEIRVAGELVARGELLVLEGNFCVRVTQLVARRVLSNCA